MANAIPVHSGKKKAAEAPTVTPHCESTDPKDFKAAQDELLERAKEIVASEIPAEVRDDQVNGIGQATMYGKFKSVTEVPYNVRNVKGEETGAVRTAIRIDH